MKLSEGETVFVVHCITAQLSCCILLLKNENCAVIGRYGLQKYILF